jgi:hypothetical protein
VAHSVAINLCVFAAVVDCRFANFKYVSHDGCGNECSGIMPDRLRRAVGWVRRKALGQWSSSKQQG